ncbi:MAG: signal recognition particle-docking protein FtsY [Gemmatimonadota bacterium]
MTRLFRRPQEGRKGLWQKVVDLALTDVRVVVGGLDDTTLEELEERLLAADFGVPATLRLVEHVEDLARRGKVRQGRELVGAMREEVERILMDGWEPGLELADDPPTVYLVAGVNGVGKTTSVGKLSHRLRQEGKKVLLAAADTYRAGAVEQLRLWAQRTGAEFVGGKAGGDPAAVAFDAVDAAVARGVDVVLVDTAGRLHTQGGLMQELEKVNRVLGKRLPGAPHETLMVLDATTGQNAIAQVRAFSKVVTPTGIILSKLDSSARGGIVVALKEEFGLPVRMVGLGEGVDDLEDFHPHFFLDGVFRES